MGGPWGPGGRGVEWVRSEGLRKHQHKRPLPIKSGESMTIHNPIFKIILVNLKQI